MYTLENYLNDMEEFKPTLYATQGGGYAEWDWRNHVPWEFEKNWKQLSQEVRRTIFIMAEKQAQREEWE